MCLLCLQDQETIFIRHLIILHEPIRYLSLEPNSNSRMYSKPPDAYVPYETKA